MPFNKGAALFNCFSRHIFISYSDSLYLAKDSLATSRSHYAVTPSSSTTTTAADNLNQRPMKSQSFANFSSLSKQKSFSSFLVPPPSSSQAFSFITPGSNRHSKAMTMLAFDDSETDGDDITKPFLPPASSQSSQPFGGSLSRPFSSAPTPPKSANASNNKSYEYQALPLESSAKFDATFGSTNDLWPVQEEFPAPVTFLPPITVPKLSPPNASQIVTAPNILPPITNEALSIVTLPLTAAPKLLPPIAFQPPSTPKIPKLASPPQANIISRPNQLALNTTITESYTSAVPNSSPPILPSPVTNAGSQKSTAPRTNPYSFPSPRSPPNNNIYLYLSNISLASDPLPPTNHPSTQFGFNSLTRSKTHSVLAWNNNNNFSQGYPMTNNLGYSVQDTTTTSNKDRPQPPMPQTNPTLTAKKSSNASNLNCNNTSASASTTSASLTHITNPFRVPLSKMPPLDPNDIYRKMGEALFKDLIECARLYNDNNKDINNNIKSECFLIEDNANNNILSLTATSSVTTNINSDPLSNPSAFPSDTLPPIKKISQVIF